MTSAESLRPTQTDSILPVQYPGTHSIRVVVTFTAPTLVGPGAQGHRASTSAITTHLVQSGSLAMRFLTVHEKPHCLLALAPDRPGSGSGGVGARSASRRHGRTRHFTKRGRCAAARGTPSVQQTGALRVLVKTEDTRPPIRPTLLPFACDS